MPRPSLSEKTRRRRAELGARIRQERETAAVTMQALAAYLEVSVSQVERFERGTAPVPADILPELARGLGITTARLLGEHRSLVAAAA